MNCCPECGMLIKTVPAGISKKTGKPYTEFQVCSNSECSYKPPREFKKPLKSVPPGLSQASKDSVNEAQSVLIGAKLDIIITLLREILRAKSANKPLADWSEEDLQSELNEQ